MYCSSHALRPHASPSSRSFASWYSSRPAERRTMVVCPHPSAVPPRSSSPRPLLTTRKFLNGLHAAAINWLCHTARAYTRGPRGPNTFRKLVMTRHTLTYYLVPYSSVRTQQAPGHKISPSLFRATFEVYIVRVGADGQDGRYINVTLYVC